MPASGGYEEGSISRIARGLETKLLLREKFIKPQSKAHGLDGEGVDVWAIAPTQSKVEV